ncbi:MAG: hypothetical protein WCO84_01625 [bacterium]
MINKYTFKELTHVKDLLKKGFITQYKQTEMTSLCKYWRDIGFSKDEARNKLISFCTKHITEFLYEVYYKEINKALNDSYVKQYKMVQIDKIDIYEEEITYLANLNLEYQYKKLLFAFICYKKIENINVLAGEKSDYLYGSDKKTKDIKQMFGLYYDIEKLICDLIDKGFISEGFKTDLRLDFINEVPQGEVLLYEISYFEDIHLYLDYYYNIGKIKHCENCGRLARGKSKYAPLKYCADCAKEIKTKKTIEARKVKKLKNLPLN